MGTDLEMSLRHRCLAPLAAILLVVSCGSDPTNTAPQQVLGQLVGLAAGRATVPKDQLQDVETLTRADIAGVTLPLMRSRLPEIGGAATASLAVVNGGVETWQASGRTDFMLDGPVLFATRGIGWDLLTAETAAPRQLLLAGKSGNYQRTLRHLAGDDAIDLVRYDCTLTQKGPQTIVVLERRHATRYATERCVTPQGAAFENAYWVGDGILWKSRQWVSPRLGYMETERLVR
jgi:hypothetical protein